jgi:hypothetical protein
MDQNRTLATSAQLISAPRTSIAAIRPALSKVRVVLVSLVISSPPNHLSVGENFAWDLACNVM